MSSKDGARGYGALLTARGLTLTPAHEARIAACFDAKQLEAWICRAASASSLDPVFDDASSG